MSFSQRLQEVRTGFERPFWVANITEIFERLSYYAVFTVIVLYLHENLHFSSEEASTLSGQFGGWVWFLAIFGGTIADKLGFRRALALAYLILSGSYFLLGSLAAPWLAPLRGAMSLTSLVTIVLILPALGVAMVKPSVVGTTARAAKENVRSLGFSIYYTLVNVGSAGGPYTASWVQHHMRIENVFRVAAISVFLMFFVVLIFFREPRKAEDAPPPSFVQTIKNFCHVLGNYRLVLPIAGVAIVLKLFSIFVGFNVPWFIWLVLFVIALIGFSRFMWFLMIFSGYWIVYWQLFLTLPLYVHDYIDPKADTSFMLGTGPIMVISLTVVIGLLTQKFLAFRAVTLGTLVSALAWTPLIIHPSVPMAYLAIACVALGEIILSPRYYEYVSRLAPAGQQGTYLGFAFMPIGIGSLIGGVFGGKLIHHFGEVTHQPAGMWWVIVGAGILTALLLWIYDRTLTPKQELAKAAS
ncbi:MAG TPA: MFS transporter [Candidatus Angelobacter sp.]|nr:MFS transporter [Candidatus Angelobacter sp.]